MTKFWTGHEIYPVTDYVNLWPTKVTLKVGDRLLRMTHLPIIVSNCGKNLQNPFKDIKVMDRTQHKPSNRQCWPWMSKCDLDPAGRGLVVAHDTSSYHNKHLCQVISDSFNKWQSYGPDTKVWRTDRRTYGRTDRRTELMSISPFLLQKGGGQQKKCDLIQFSTFKIIIKEELIIIWRINKMFVFKLVIFFHEQTPFHIFFIWKIIKVHVNAKLLLPEQLKVTMSFFEKWQ
jgi:hypothetical protein